MKTEPPIPERGRERGVKLRDIRAAMLRGAKSRAAKAGLPFNLTLDDIVIPDQCPIFGTDLVLGQGQASDASPSLDKIIPALGYVRGNVLVISNRANRIKNNATIAELGQIARFYRQHITARWMRN